MLKKLLDKLFKKPKTKMSEEMKKILEAMHTLPSPENIIPIARDFARQVAFITQNRKID